MNSRKLFETLFCAIAVLQGIPVIAQGQDALMADSRYIGYEENSSLETTSDGSQDAGWSDAICASSRPSSRWTASADFILLERIGSVNRTLVERVPASYTIGQLSSAPGVEALNVTDLHEGMRGGPRIGLMRRGDSGYDLDFSYFQIDGWSSARTIGPDDPADWLIMRAPGGFLQTQDHPTQAMGWEQASKLYNAELNVRWHPYDRLTLLAGIRWIDFSESLIGSLEPSEGFPPFWNTSVNNNLFGLQIGADAKILEHGRFSIEGVFKAGIFDDNASQSTGVSIFKEVRPTAAATNHAAFLGETGLQCKYQVAKGLLLKAGYEAIWLEGVALAAGQIQDTLLIPPDTVHPLGVNCDSGVFFHGATTGLEYSF
jgi:hypothetical protein